MRKIRLFPSSNFIVIINIHLFSPSLERGKWTSFQIPCKIKSSSKRNNDTAHTSDHWDEGHTHSPRAYLRQHVEDVGVHQPLLVPVLGHSQHLGRDRRQGWGGDVHVVPGGHGQEARNWLNSANLVPLSFSKLAARRGSGRTFCLQSNRQEEKMGSCHIPIPLTCLPNCNTERCD